MAQPPPYDRQFNFQNQQLQTPADPPPADEMDAEYNAIKLTLDATLANLALIQRDDGQLANETVGEDQLKPELALLGNSLAEILVAAAEVEADRVAAEASKNAAAGSETNAASSASSAASSANAAQTARTNAETAETNAETAETNAELAETQAELAQFAAETAMTEAQTAAAAAEQSAAKLQGTSATSITIGTGPQTFVTQPSKFFTAGTQLLITSDANPSVNYLHGAATVYAGTSLTVDVTDIGGSGTYTDWTIQVSGTRGSVGAASTVPGPSGTSGAPGIQFNFAASTTDSDPGDGNFRFDNTDPAVATAIYIDNKEITGTDVSVWLDTFDDAGDASGRGNLQIIDPENTAIFRIFVVTGSIVDGTGYRKISVTHISGSGVFSAAAPASFAFFRRGPTGATGPTGDVSAAAAFATDERLIRSDGTVKGVQASTVSLTDAGAMSGLTTLITSGAVTVGTTAATAPIIDPSGFAQVPVIVAPATPADSFVRFYAKSDGHLYQKDSAGAETDLTIGVTFASQAEAEAGTINTKSISPQSFSQAFANSQHAFRNMVGRNGGFEVWQRGAGDASSIAVAATTTLYTADGWYLVTGATQAHVVSAQAGLVDGSRLCARVQRNSGQTGTGTVRFAFPMDADEVVRLRGRCVQLVFTTATGANWSPTSGTLTYNLYVGTAAVAKRGASAYGGEANPVTGTVNLAQSATAAQTVSAITTAIASTVTCAELQFSWAPAGTAGANDWVSIDDVMLCSVPAGLSAATPRFERSDFAMDLTRCQRHFWKTYAYSTAPGNNYATTNAGALSFSGPSAQVAGGYSLPGMRSAPTMTYYDGVGTSGKVDYYTAGPGWNNNGAITSTAATHNAARIGKFDAAATIITFDVTADAGI